MIEIEPLAAGAEGEQVEELQRRLHYLGHYEGDIDGRYGDRTEDAVRRFQSFSGKPDDGKVERDTWETLDREAQFAGYDPYAAARSDQATATQNTGQLSEDGNWRWDGTDWQPVHGQGEATPVSDSATGQLSDDGQWRWDGTQWQPVNSPTQPAGATGQLPNDLKPEPDLLDKARDKAHDKLGYDTWQKILSGEIGLKDLTEATTYYELAKSTLAFDPTTLVTMVAGILAELADVIRFGSKIDKYQGVTYGLLWGALDMGAPPAPQPSGTTTHIDQDAFYDGVTQAQAKLGNPKTKNQLLLHIAEHGEEATLHAVWKKVIAGSRQEQNLALYQLQWPNPR